MYSENMYKLGSKRSVIRELFEFGKRRAAEIGEDNVFDFSLGNPNVPAPQALTQTIKNLIDSINPAALHGYTSAQGDAGTRKAIADNLNKRYNASFSPDNIYMTCGAAASLTIAISALNSGNSEFITFSPYFPEYAVFTAAAGGVFKALPINGSDFSIDVNTLYNAITPKTQGIIINSPNNPSGYVYTRQNLIAVADVLRKKSEEYNHPIYLLSDEPYREIVYNGTEVTFLPEIYDNTIISYSYSKSLSLPGERIGYLAVSPKACDAEKVYLACLGAGRALGYVCAPALFQAVIKETAGLTSDLKYYERNRNLLYNALKDYGYDCVRPDGAFYLFIKTPVPDAYEFCEHAKNYNILIVPGDDFGAPGYARIAYCVKTEVIEKALPSFKALIKNFA